jgi:hypothetical protein
MRPRRPLPQFTNSWGLGVLTRTNHSPATELPAATATTKFPRRWPREIHTCSMLSQFHQPIPAHCLGRRWTSLHDPHHLPGPFAEAKLFKPPHSHRFSPGRAALPNPSATRALLFSFPAIQSHTFPSQEFLGSSLCFTLSSL